MFSNHRYFRMALLIGILVLVPGSAFCAAATAQDYLEDARTLIDNGEYDAAVIQLKNALLLESDNVSARLLLGKIYIEIGDGASAEKEISYARNKGLEQARWLAPLGHAYLLSGRHDAILREILVEDGQSIELQAEIHQLRGQAYYAKGQLQEADISFIEALKLQPAAARAIFGRSRIAHYNGDIIRAMDLVDETLSIEPNMSEALALKGELLREAGQIDRAVYTFERALDHAPDYVPARLGLAASLIMMGENDKALAEIGQVQARYPNLYTAYYLTALAMAQQMKLEQAEESLILALEQAPGHLPSRLLFGMIAYHRNQMDQAELHLEKYLNSDPKNLKAVKYLAVTLSKLNKHDDAIELLESRLQYSFKDPQFLALLGSEYLRSGDSGKGLEYLQMAVAAAPDIAALRMQLAVGQLANGSPEEAISELKVVVDLEQDMIQADSLLVLMYLKQREYEKALDAATAYAEKHPDKALPLNMIGTVQLAIKDFEAAEAAFESAVKVEPGFIPARHNLAKLSLARGSYNDARKHFTEVLAFDENNLQAMIALADLANQSGDKGVQAIWLKRAWSSHPQKLKPAFLLIEHYLDSDEVTSALDIAQQLQKTHPDNTNVMRMLAIVQINAKQNSMALATLDTLVEIEPESPKNYYLLARAQLQQHDLNSARQSLIQCLKLQEDFPEAIFLVGQLDLMEKRHDAAHAVASALQDKYPEKSYGYELDGDIHAVNNKNAEASHAYAIAYSKAGSAVLAKKLFLSRQKEGANEAAFSILQDWRLQKPDE